MDIKIDEINKRLTISVRLNMGGDLEDLLDIADDELFSDIDNYVNLSQGNITKEIIEEKISEGLRLLMEMYANEWTSECKECEGSGEIECTICEGSGENKDEDECKKCEGSGIAECCLCSGEGELLLHNAMDHQKIQQFKQSWKLIELNNNWTEENFILSNQLDEDNLDLYYDIIDA